MARLHSRFTAHACLASFALLALILALDGCGSAAFKAGAVNGGLTATSSVAFGSVPVGKSASNYVKLVNQGSAPVTISQVNVAGQGFSSSVQDSLPMTVGAQSTFNLGVQFNPAVAGQASGQLTISNTAGTAPLAVSLSGTGTATTTTPNPGGTLSSITCVNSAVTGSLSDNCTVTLSAAASSDITVNLVSDNAAVTVPAAVLVPSGNSSAAFTATVFAVSSVQTATITASDATTSQKFALQLGAVLASFDVSQSDINFGDVGVEDSASQSLTVISTGNAPVTIDSISIAGQGYSISGATYPLTLNPNQTATLIVQFSPKASGASLGQISLDAVSTINTLAMSTMASSNSGKKVRLTANAVPQVKQLGCSKTSIMSGSATDCSVTLNAAAASTGQAIALASSSNALAVPTAIMVPAGGTSATFTASASTITNSQTATLTASTTSGSKALSLQLTPSTSTLTLSAATLAFGNVAVNSPTSQVLTLSSTGTVAVTVSAAAVTGSGFAISGATFPLTLNPGQTASLNVQFGPSAAGTASGQLTLSSDSSTGSPSVIALSGTGVPVLSGLSCANGSMTGAGTDTCTVTLNAAVASGGFSVNLASNNTAVTVPGSISVPAGSTSAVFTSNVSTVTTAQTAMLTASAGGVAQTFSIQLGGQSPTLSVSSASLSFGSVAVNSPVVQSLTLSSTGAAPVTVNAATVSGAGFSVSGATFPLTLNVGQTATLSVQFTPNLAGNLTGQLTLTSNSSSGSSSVINLSGTGVPVLNGFSCSSGSITGAGTDSCSLTLSVPAATGGFAVNLASNNSAVTVPSSVTIPANATTATFTANIASVTSTQTATLTASIGSATKTFAVQLNVGTSTLSINATSIAFGNVSLNTPTTQTVTLTSTGSGPVTISSIALTGTGFTASGTTAPLTLNPNQSATLNVIFNPTTAGSFTGQLTITSNSSSGTTNVINITGAGISHQVNLTWIAPAASPDPVAGYIVYRAPNGSTAYAQLNPSAVTQTTYVDGAVVSGQTYTYIVESVDAAGYLSPPSNAFSAAIP